MESPKDRFKKKVLKNGMTVLFEKRDIPVVSVAFAVRQGGINESQDEKGLSHFIEHLVFKGTPSRNQKKIGEEIEKNGGEINAFTGEELTLFLCKMPSKHIKIALNVLSDIIKNPLFEEEEIVKERKVIFEELKMRKDSPRVYVHDKIQSFLYEKPFGLDLIGTYETMNSITRDKIVQRFKEIYSPDNMILCVVGDANFDEIIDFAEKNFDKPESPANVQNFEIKKRNEQKIETRKNIDQANLIFAYHTPLLREKNSYAAMVLNTVMAEGMSSRLFLEIREKRNLAYSVKGEDSIRDKFSYNSIYVGTTKDNLEKVKSLILEEFDKVSKELGEEELEMVKEQLIGNYLINMESSQEQMVNLIDWEIRSDAEEFYEFEKRIRDVKLDDVKNLSKIKNYSFFALIPEN